MDSQTLLIALVSLVLLAAAMSFAVAGVRQHRRRVQLARWAGRLGLRFSEDDLLDVPQSCAAFALVSCGHSPAACNLAYGRVEGWTIRMFDFRYEIGHGTRRLARRYEVMMADLPKAPRDLLMWREADFTTLAPAANHTRHGQWECLGEAASWEAIARSLGEDASGACVQVHGNRLMIALAGLGKGRSFDQRLAQLQRVAKEVSRGDERGQSGLGRCQG